MAVVAILGAGAMGSALTTPFRDNAHEVRLWGTHLDGDVLAVLRSGQPHPRTAVHLPEGVGLFDSDDLPAALDGVDVVAVAVTSDGAVPVSRRAAPHLTAGTPVLLTSKGFDRDDAGRVRLLTGLLNDVLGPFGLPPVVAVGGPCKANEVAARRPTACVFAGPDPVARDTAARLAGTGVYRPQLSRDDTGVEVAAALKNVYAIALGICDGLAERGGQPWHDLKAATFAQAVREIVLLVTASGGDPETGYGLAGCGDLEVTGLSGRNKAYGVRIGAGELPSAALREMTAQLQTVEGVAACRFADELVGQDRLVDPVRLPLLHAVTQTLLQDRTDVAGLLAHAVLPPPVAGGTGS